LITTYNRNYKCRITQDVEIGGIKAVVLENELLRITILVDKGADIYEFLYKPQDIDFAWRAPNKLSNPMNTVPTTGNEEGTFLDRYEGGFQEILPNGGTACTYKGAKLGQHGEISNIPWEYQILCDEEHGISVKFSTRTFRTPFYIEKTMMLKSQDPTLYIDEMLINEGNEDIELMWGHHPTIGHPFLSDQCEIVTTATRVRLSKEISFETQRLEPGSIHSWPLTMNKDKVIDFSKVPSREANCADLVYLSDFEGEASYEVINKELNLSFGMRWDKKLFNYLWMWQVCGGSYGYPWYGRTYNLALEPWTSYPSEGLEVAIKNGTSLKMKKHEIRSTQLAYFVRIPNATRISL